MLERLPEFIGNHPILSLLFLGLLGTLIYTEIARTLRKFKEVSPAELTQLINRSDAMVVDVSAQTDFDRGHIVNSRHLAASQVDPESKLLAPHRDKPLAVVCRTGMTSQQVCNRLSKAGFSQVYTLKGGLQSWINENLPVTRAKH